MQKTPIPFGHKLVKAMSGAKIIISLHLSAFIIFFTTVGHASVSSKPAAWVIRWHIDSPSEIKEICHEAQGSFSNLLIQVRGRADAYYDSDIAPRAEELEELPIYFDPLALILDQCKGLTLHAWLNVYYLWTGEDLPKNPLHPARQHNNWIVHDNNGKSVSDYSPLEQSQGWIEGVYADPASLSYRNYFWKVVEELIEKYDIKGIHLDFIRYPGLPYGYQNRLSSIFFRRWGFDPRWLPDTISENDILRWLAGSMKTEERILTTGTLIWAAMRAEEVTSMLKGLRKITSSSNRDLILSAAVFPDQISAFLTKGQDWQFWAQENLIDHLYPMSYFGGSARIGRQLHNIADSLQETNIRLYAGLGAYIKDSNEIAEESRVISTLPYDGIALFSLGHLKNKKNWSKPYTTAISNTFQSDKTQSGTMQLSAVISSDRSQKEVLRSIRDLHKETAAQGNHKQVILDRRNEFINLCKTVIQPLIKKMERTPGNTPAWLDMRGIFRYVHPYDSQEKILKQKELAYNARKMIINGENPFLVAKKYSQAGARQFGSPLPRYFLSTGKEFDRQLWQIQSGDVSKVIKQDDGYWVYQIVDRGNEGLKTFPEIPWPARRLMLREKMADYFSNSK